MSKDIKKALEHCVEWKCDNCPNGDDLGSGETVCRGRLLPQVLEYVADLEAKLAESNENIKLLEQDRVVICNTMDMYIEKVEKLKHQLAEKDEEIKCRHWAIKSGVYIQDKISFAVDILEELADCSNYINSKLDFECGSYVSEKAIRDKIEYLKGKKDE